MKEIASIVLAGGKGTRMDSDLPKVLHQLNNKPLILHVIENLNKAGINNITVVVGYKGEKVIEVIKKKCKHVWQYEQLGTGHAVIQAESEFKNFSGKIIVACGDVPLIKSDTFKSLINQANEDDIKAVVLTMSLENPTGYGRIVKNEKGAFLKIVEEKDASDSERKIQEVNTGTYIFDKKYLFDGLKKIDTNNAQGEYYLPDALNYIIESGKRVKTLLLENAIEGRGINTMKELINLENYVNSSK